MSGFHTILITGGAGFVGSSLALSLRRDFADVRVVALDNLTRRGSELNLPRLAAAGVEFVHGDVRRQEDLEAVGAFDLLIDCAAEASVQAGIGTSPKPVFDVNLTGTINCLEVAHKNHAAFLFLSTSRVYPIQSLNEVPWIESETRFEWRPGSDAVGVSAEGITEAFQLQGARSYYGTSKLASEMIAQEYAASTGMPVLINRCGVLTGPWQMGKVDQGVVALWVMRHHFEQPLRFIGYGGTGRQVRDILHVKDLYRLVRKQLACPETWKGRIFNVGGGRDVSVSLYELTGLCQRITGCVVPILPVAETNSVDLRIYCTDSNRAKTDFDWAPKFSVEQIVEEIYEWVLQNEAALAQTMGFYRPEVRKGDGTIARCLHAIQEAR